MENLSFDSMPAAISQLLAKVTNIEKQLTENDNGANAPDCWFSIEELCNYLPGKPAKATVYSKVQRREIPHQKTGKRLSFLKSEIDTWLKSQSRTAKDSMSLDGATFLKNKKGHNP